MQDRESGLSTAAAFRLRARRAVPRFLFDYIEGGAGAEICQRGNRADLDAVMLVGRPLDGSGSVDCGVTIGGRRIAMPVLIAPMGLADLIRPAADVAMANVANRAGIPFIQSGASFTRYENLPHGGDAPPWYQIYVYEEEAAVATLARLSQNGCENVMVTVDMPVGGVRHRDLANHFGPRISATMFLQSCARPMWQFRHARARLMSPVPRSPLPTAIAQRRFDKPLSWDHLRRLREAWRGRFWIKGLLHPEDAVRAAEMGFDGVVASNHGGRQLDLSPSAWRMLSEMRSALPDGYPLMADGGVRSGEDIARAIALGASAVLIGRPVLYALAAAGEDGVAKMVARLHHEFDVAMRLLGCQTVAGLGAFPAFSKHRCGLE